ncbi:hypothetical protein QBC40DRAFT_232551 [Triangularia verruculosa]|uniref:Uncharacterized protein n=1 Tax=Triangularia verruculosa TaxID=2587418 RepID=A0AAN6XB91_9PEZI|nr:hypothetical protein QBC40DRAFT_232551 [Triangularia verruculosa]
MIPKHKRFILEEDSWDDTVYSCVFFDQERRQYMQLQLSAEAVPKVPDNHVRRIEAEKKFNEYVNSWLPEICDTLPPDRQSFLVDAKGKLLSSDKSTIPVHPAYLDKFTLPVPWVASFVPRDRLVELVRRSGQVDRVSYHQEDRPGEGGTVVPGKIVEADFRYYCTKDAKATTDCLRNMLLCARFTDADKLLGRFQHAVTEGDQVVGYLTQAARGPSIYTFSTAKKRRPFKLKHLHQLLQGIHTLNLTYGLVSMDLQANYIVIDQDTDELWFRSFNHCVPITPQNAMFDVVLAYILMYEKITHDVQTPPRNLAEAQTIIANLAAREPWVKSDSAELDHDQSEYRKVMDRFLLHSYMGPLFPGKYSSVKDLESQQPEEGVTGLRGGSAPRAPGQEGEIGQEPQLSPSKKRQGEDEDPGSTKRSRTEGAGPKVNVNWEEAVVPETLETNIPTSFTKAIGGQQVDITSPKLWHRSKNEATKENPVVSWYRPPTDSGARARIKCLLANGQAAPEDDAAGRWNELLIPQPEEDPEELSDWDSFALNVPQEGPDFDVDLRAFIEGAARAAAVARQAAVTAQEATRSAKAEAKKALDVVAEVKEATELAQAVLAGYVAGNAELAII